MIVTIHQPNFLPYLGFFDKMFNSDILIIYDNTQFKNNDFQNRNKIRTKNGWQWLTVPIKSKFKTLIKDVKINNTTNWQKKHWKSIEINYSKSQYFKDYKEELKKIYFKDWNSLLNLNIELIKFISTKLDIKTKIVLASNMVNLKTKNTQALIDLCKLTNANTYISRKDGRKYLNESLFEKEKIKLKYQNYNHPTYKQTYLNFEPYMTTLDILFNHGPNSLNIILNNF